MITLISLVAALALSAIPITLGWRRSVDEASMARAMGIAAPKKRFEPEKFARQTGTGLAFNQSAYGFLVWSLEAGSRPVGDRDPAGPDSAASTLPDDPVTLQRVRTGFGSNSS